MRSLYTLGIHLYRFAIFLASAFNEKARLWRTGRKNILSRLSDALKEKKPTVWFHCASLGEFEQGRPLMERLKKQHPEYRILLTFFSPSGYEVRKNYAGADHVFYLPVDTPGNAKRFVQLVQPKAVFFVKYEFWYNYLGELQRKNIPHYLVSAVFRPSQHFFRGYGSWFRKALNGYTWIFTQEKSSLELLQSVGVKNASVSGDTRFDRVAEIAASAKDIPVAAAFAGAERNVLVAGSTWPADEEKLAAFFEKNPGWKLLIAPHEIGDAHLDALEKQLRAASSFTSAGAVLRFSKADEKTAAQARALVIDNIGMLSSLYRYGKIAYIGGGFGAGIHNILEAAVYGMPVLFGPNHQKFNEAKMLITEGGAFSFSSAEELEKYLNGWINDPAKLALVSKIAGDFVRRNGGATEKILQHLR